MQSYRGFRDLIVYQLSFKLACEIFELSKTFPKEEKYSLTDQIRRASRSVPANIGEAWSKRRYPKVFVNKLTDSDGESNETTIWLDFALEHKYLNKLRHNYLIEKYSKVGKMLGSMINKPDKFCY